LSQSAVPRRPHRPLGTAVLAEDPCLPENKPVAADQCR
jgi:hypothetical protein